MATYTDQFSTGPVDDLGVDWTVDFDVASSTVRGWEIDASNNAYAQGNPADLQRYARYETAVGVNGWAEITVANFSPDGNSQLGVCFRAPASGNSMDSYMVMYDHNNGSGTLRIRETSGGTSPSRTYLGTGVSYTPSNGDRIAIELSTNGSSQPVIRSYVNDVLQETFTDTSSTHTTGTKAGLFCYTAGTDGNPFSISSFSTGDTAYLTGDQTIESPQVAPVVVTVPYISGGDVPTVESPDAVTGSVGTPYVIPGAVLVEPTVPIPSSTVVQSPTLDFRPVAIVVSDINSPSDIATRYFSAAEALGYSATYVLDTAPESSGYALVVITPETSPSTMLAKFFPDTAGDPPVLLANPFLWDDWGITDGTPHTVYNATGLMYLDRSYLQWDEGTTDFFNTSITSTNEAIGYSLLANLTVTSERHTLLMANVFVADRIVSSYYPAGVTGLNSTTTAPILTSGAFNTVDPVDIDSNGTALIEDMLSALLTPSTELAVLETSADVSASNVTVIEGTGATISVDPVEITGSAGSVDVDPSKVAGGVVDATSVQVSAAAVAQVAGTGVEIVMVPYIPILYGGSEFAYDDPTMEYGGGQAVAIVSASDVTVTTIGSAKTIGVDPVSVSASASDPDLSVDRVVAVSVDPVEVTVSAEDIGASISYEPDMSPGLVTVRNRSVAVEAGGNKVVIADEVSVAAAGVDVTVTTGGAVDIPVDAAAVSVSAEDATYSGQDVVNVVSVAGFTAVSSIGATVTGDAEVTVDSTDVSVEAVDIAVLAVQSVSLDVDASDVTVSAESVSLNGNAEVTVDSASVDAVAVDPDVVASTVIDLTVDPVSTSTGSGGAVNVFTTDSLAPYVVKQVITGVPSPSTSATTQDLGVAASVGDILLAILVADNDMGTVVPPVGWDLLVAKFDNNGGGALTQAVYWRSANVNEPRTYDWAWANPQGMAISVLQIRGADIRDLVDASATSYGSGLTHDSPTVTSLTDHTLVIRSIGVSQVVTITPPLGVDELTNFNSSPGTGNVSAAVTAEYGVFAGALDTREFTISTSADTTMVTLALRPVTVVAVPIAVDPVQVVADSELVAVTGDVNVSVDAVSVDVASEATVASSDVNVTVDETSIGADAEEVSVTQGVDLVIDEVGVATGSISVGLEAESNISVVASEVVTESEGINFTTTGNVLLTVDAVSVITAAGDAVAGQPDIPVTGEGVLVSGAVSLSVSSVNDKATYVAGRYQIVCEQGSALRQRLTFTNTDGSDFDLSDYTVTLRVQYGRRRSNQTVLTLSEGNGISVAGNVVLLNIPDSVTALIDDSGTYRLNAESSYGKIERLLSGKFLVKINAGR